MKPFVRLFAVVIGSVVALASPVLAQAAATNQLNALLQEQWEYQLRTQPEGASLIYGDNRYNDKLGDFSQAAIDRDLVQKKVFLKKFLAINTTGLSEQDQRNHSLMVRNLKLELEGAVYKNWEMPVSQFDGLHLNLPQLGALLSFATVKDYEDYIARLNQIPRVFNETIIQMRKGRKDGLMPPKILLVQVVTQSESIANLKLAESPFMLPLSKFPKSFSDQDKQRLRQGIISAMRTQVLPSYQKFIRFVRDDYAPYGRKTIGTWALPQGAARYAFAIRDLTTTSLPAESIHQLGLREVTRIEAEELLIAQKLGFKDLISFKASLKTNADLHPKSGEQILGEYRTYTQQMEAKLPELFGRLPKAKVIVLPIEPFREKQSAAADYFPGAVDGSRPGHINVNTYDYANQLTITNESTAYHEGVPGHHMQISIAQELTQLPPFRKYGSYTAFIEGWALYSEVLGKEVGFYQDPYSDFGRLEDEIWRAIRLVVDTGIHAKKWTRPQVIQFMRDHSTSSEANIQSEADRYISWPAQALAYKLGQLTILRLREDARTQLAEKFDIRTFHDFILGSGALPLDVLEEGYQRWVAGAKAEKRNP
jgi:uncharacterized protein (DUF885 family)